MRRAYISGAITGVRKYKERFNDAEILLKHIGGYDSVVNPVDIANEINFPFFTKDEDKYKVIMREDLKVLLTCTHIYMLNGWSKSKGAIIEMIVARICGIHIIFENPQNIPGWGIILKFLTIAINRKV